MSIRLFWSGFAILAVLCGALFLGTWIHDDDGDPWICLDCWRGGHHHHRSEIAAWRHLHRVARSQFEYFNTDPDAKGRKEYWKKDIAGLWSNPDQSCRRMGLLWLRDALADDRPEVDLSPFGVRTASDGYRIRSLLHADEGTPSATRFAACAYPERYGYWKWTFIVDETGILYRKDLGQTQGVPMFPRDPKADGWQHYRDVR